MDRWQQRACSIRTITFSQQYGSGGERIASQLAERLQWLVTDQEVVARVACLLDITEEEAAIYDRHAFSLLDRFLCHMRYTTPESMEAWASSPFILPLSLRAQERTYRETRQHVLEELAHAGSRIILGHAGQKVLAGRPDVLHIRVVAPDEARVRSIMRQECLDEAAARARVRQRDRHWQRYYQHHYKCDFNDPLLYDLVLNSSALDTESQVDLICVALGRKARPTQKARETARLVLVR